MNSFETSLNPPYLKTGIQLIKGKSNITYISIKHLLINSCEIEAFSKIAQTFKMIVMNSFKFTCCGKCHENYVKCNFWLVMMLVTSCDFADHDEFINEFMY